MPHRAVVPLRPAATLLAAALAFVLPQKSGADTEVCGTLRLATEWTTLESPYLVTGDIFIPQTSRLRIAAGVIVKFAKPRACPSDKEPQPQADWSDSTYTGIKAEGTFYSLGTEDRPVIFETEDAQDGAASTGIGWDGIRFTGQKAQSSEIAFTVFRGANSAVMAEKAGFFIHHCLFEGNNTGVTLGLRADLAIVNCAFIDNLSAGIVIRQAGPRIANSIFSGNRSYGIWADSRPAIQIMNNAFWDNHEENCYKCPFQVLEPAAINANKDTCDKFGNLVADPIFIGSRSYLAAQDADLKTDTPAHLVKDQELAKLEAESRAKIAKAEKADKTGGGKTSDFKPMGKGPYLLSQYSKLTHAGLAGGDFKNRDGSRNDIGLHGGTMGRITKDPF